MLGLVSEPNRLQALQAIQAELTPELLKYLNPLAFLFESGFSDVPEETQTALPWRQEPWCARVCEAEKHPGLQAEGRQAGFSIRCQRFLDICKYLGLYSIPRSQPPFFFLTAQTQKLVVQGGGSPVPEQEMS